MHFLVILFYISFIFFPSFPPVFFLSPKVFLTDFFFQSLIFSNSGIIVEKFDVEARKGDSKKEGEEEDEFDRRKRRKRREPRNGRKKNLNINRQFRTNKWERCWDRDRDAEIETQKKLSDAPLSIYHANILWIPHSGGQHCLIFDTHNFNTNIDQCSFKSIRCYSYQKKKYINPFFYILCHPEKYHKKKIENSFDFVSGGEKMWVSIFCLGFLRKFLWARSRMWWGLKFIP